MKSSPSYLKFLRGKSCVVCQRPAEHAHHVRLGHSAGVGMKPPDSRALPMCGPCHAELHHRGERSYWEATHVGDPFLQVMRYLTEWALKKGIPLERLVIGMERVLEDRLVKHQWGTWGGAARHCKLCEVFWTPENEHDFCVEK